MRTVNEVVTRTEEIGEELNPYYEIIRQAIDEEKVADLELSTLQNVEKEFTTGTKEYEEMLQKILSLKPTVKILGVHKKFQRAFETYVEGCQEMCDSIDTEKGTVDVEKFNDSEAKQDEATKVITFCIQRIAQQIR